MADQQPSVDRRMEDPEQPVADLKSRRKPGADPYDQSWVMLRALAVSGRGGRSPATCGFPQPRKLLEEERQSCAVASAL